MQGYIAKHRQLPVTCQLPLVRVSEPNEPITMERQTLPAAIQAIFLTCLANRKMINASVTFV